MEGFTFGGGSGGGGSSSSGGGFVFGDEAHIRAGGGFAFGGAPAPAGVFVFTGALAGAASTPAIGGSAGAAVSDAAEPLVGAFARAEQARDALDDADRLREMMGSLLDAVMPMLLEDRADRGKPPKLPHRGLRARPANLRPPTLFTLCLDAMRLQLMEAAGLSLENVRTNEPAINMEGFAWFETLPPDTYRRETCMSPRAIIRSALRRLVYARCPHDRRCCPACRPCYNELGYILDGGPHQVTSRPCPDFAMTHLLGALGSYLAAERPPTPPIPRHYDPGRDDGKYDDESYRERRERHLQSRVWGAYAFP